jgi:hypothetical protein
MLYYYHTIYHPALYIRQRRLPAAALVYTCIHPPTPQHRHPQHRHPQHRHPHTQRAGPCCGSSRPLGAASPTWRTPPVCMRGRGQGVVVVVLLVLLLLLPLLPLLVPLPLLLLLLLLPLPLPLQCARPCWPPPQGRRCRPSTASPCRQWLSRWTTRTHPHTHTHTHTQQHHSSGTAV